jgi:hypothetical protein
MFAGITSVDIYASNTSIGVQALISHVQPQRNMIGQDQAPTDKVMT